LHHEKAIQAVRQNVSQINKSLMSADAADQRKGNEDEIQREFNEYSHKSMPPLKAMEILARYLPEGARVSGLTLKEYDLEVSFSSGNPLEVIKKLSAVREIGKVQLKGAPAKDAKSGLFSFTITLQLAR